MNTRTTQLSALYFSLLAVLACESIPEFIPDLDISGDGNGDVDDVANRRGKDSIKPDVTDPQPSGGQAMCEGDCGDEAPGKLETCGDGRINQVSEQCDDGKTVDGDGCSAACQLEPGWECAEEGKACNAMSCGDKLRAGAEQCDDGNTDGGDGCSSGCQTEPFFDCPRAGGACTYLVECGDRKVQLDEVCDDGNREDADGCNSTCSAIEDGYVCSIHGAPCEAALCGDGKVAGTEQCDGGDVEPVVGCSDSCTLLEGFKCSGSPSICELTVCGDGVKEGNEPCDDGNLIPWDGCSPTCQAEPRCAPGGGACSSTCGDGMLLPGDEGKCDDGNTTDGDGCSSSCEPEDGWVCEASQAELPEQWDVPVAYRDFNHNPKNGGIKHPDFEVFSGDDRTWGMVEFRLDGTDGLPVYTGVCEEGNLVGACPFGGQSTGEAEFDQWYRSMPGINYELFTTMTLLRQADDSYSFAPQEFFPLNGYGFTDPSIDEEALSGGNNYGFTSELRGWFAYAGDERLDFSGDDDVWVFINGRLALDLGGLHPEEVGTVVLSGSKACASYDDGPQTCRELGLQIGEVYEIALFHAERHTWLSNFDLTMRGFLSDPSECQTVCGDGIVAGNEVCDDGINDGGYMGCQPDCLSRGPYCGDGLKDADEDCDDGVNTSLYGGCATGCVFGPSCGDGKIQPAGGEQCDDGVNDGGYDECAPGCEFDERCGDGVVQEAEGEVCDDGTNISRYDGCAPGCVLAPYCGDGVIQESEGETCDDQDTDDDDACSNSCELRIVIPL